MNSLSADELSARLCSICLNTVVDDNSRGKAELVCGHLFHLDCIGSEFNYRTEMKCPNCRVVENGEWLIPDEDADEEEEFTVQVVNRRLELHIYSHGGRAGEQNGGELSSVAPTVHYHHHQHNNIVLPQNNGGGATAVVYNNDPLTANTTLRSYGGPQPQGSDSGRRARPDHGVLQERPATRVNVGDMIMRPHNPQPHVNLATAALQENRVVPAAAQESDQDSYDDPSLELTLTTNPSVDEHHGTHDPAPAPAPDHSPDHATADEPAWFHPLE